MSDLKSFSVGHTAKGVIWWQAWPFDGEPRKGTADTIGGALDLIGVGHAPSEDAARDAMTLVGQIIDKDGEIARLTAEIADLQAANLRLGVKVSAMVGAIDRLEAALPDTYDPAHDAPAKGPSSPVATRKPVKASKGPSAVQDGPMADSDPVGAYLAEVRRG